MDIGRPISGGEVLKKIPASFGVSNAAKNACTMNAAVPSTRRGIDFLPKEAYANRRMSAPLSISRDG